MLLTIVIEGDIRKRSNTASHVAVSLSQAQEEDTFAHDILHSCDNVTTNMVMNFMCLGTNQLQIRSFLQQRYDNLYIYILIGNIFTSEKIFPNTLESSVTKSMVGHERSVTLRDMPQGSLGTKGSSGNQHSSGTFLDTTRHALP